MNEPAQCVFCDIVDGHVEASRVLDDERALAFLDVQPVNPGHTLVVPKRHARGLAELGLDDGAALMRAAQRIAAGLRRSGVRCEGVNLWLADGEAAGQEVPHVHLHVVPRFAGDGFALRLGPEYRVRERAELDTVAAQLRAAVA